MKDTLFTLCSLFLIALVPIVTPTSVFSVAAEGGSISPAGIMEVTPGQTLLFSFRPNVGYEVDMVLVNGMIQASTRNLSLTITGDETHSVSVFFRSKEGQRLTRSTKPKFVGILYETWFNQLDKFSYAPIYPQPVSNLQYRYWGEPLVGRYRSNNVSVINQHADWLAAANVDFIALDYSNDNVLNSDLNGPLSLFLSTYAERVAKRIPTPRITFLTKSVETEISLIKAQAFDSHPHLWFNYQGKPLLLTVNACPWASCAPFNIRQAWGLLAANDNRWSFLQQTPQPVYLNNGVPEEMAVSAAQQSSYMSDLSSARGRLFNYRTGKNNGYEGQNFDDQWSNAISKGVSFVFIKSWNEWCSLQLPNGYFTDEFNREYSNDLEPMRGGHGDLYYRKLKEHVAKFKA